MKSLNGTSSRVPARLVVKCLFLTFSVYPSGFRLGDAVLKMVQTDSLLYSKDFAKWIDFLHEGDLSTLRSGKLLVWLSTVTAVT